MTTNPTSRNEHCSDETLIRHLDLELSPAEAEQVRLHLGACWHCRARLDSFASTIHEIATLANDDTFPAPGRADAARQEFLAEVARRNASARPGPVGQPLHRPRRLAWLGAVAAALTIAIIGFTALRQHTPPPSVAANPTRNATPAVITARIEAAETAAIPAKTAVVQTLRAQLAENRPQPRRNAITVELWSDPPTRRAGLRWLDAQGMVIRTALHNNGTRPNMPALSDPGLDWTALAERFAGQLAARNTPLLLVSEFNDFCRRVGVEPRVEQTEPRILLSAVYISTGGRTRYWLEADPATMLPVRQGMRIAQDGREFEIIVEPEGQVTARRFQPELFVNASFSKTQPPSVPPASPVLPLAVRPGSMLDAVALEMQVRYALFRASAHTNDPLVIEPLRGRRILVKGIAATPRRAAELEASLGNLRESVDWQVAAAPQRNDGQPRPERTISRAIHAEAWALVQLAQRYDAASVAALPEPSAQLLRTMIRQRLERIDTQTALFRSVLSAPPSSPLDSQSAMQANWPDGVFALYRQTASLESLIDAHTPVSAYRNVLDRIDQATAALRLTGSDVQESAKGR